MPSKSKIRERRRVKSPLFRSQRSGAIIVLFAILLPLLVLILGFTVDYAYILRSRNETRVIADLAAKAAADTLARTGGDEAAAMAAARFIASNNTVAGNPVELRDDQIIFGRSYKQADDSFTYVAGDRPTNAVQVLVRRDNSSVGGPISTFFGAPYGRPTFNTAELAEASFRDVEIVLVLDRSGSMKFDLVDDASLNREERLILFCKPPVPSSRWVTMSGAIDVFIDELRSTPAKERVGMVTFSEPDPKTCPDGVTRTFERVTLESPLSQDLNKITGNMDRLNNAIWFGGTNITAGLREARLHFDAEGSASVEKIIICLTDGVHTVKSEDAPHVEATRCFDAGITVHTITFSEGANLTDMIRTAENGGGSHSHAPDEDTLKVIFRRLAGTASFFSK